ncbi:MAG: alanine--tRNA ligase [Candidatus Paceibacterota bacterium]
MKSNEIREKFLKYFEDKGHAVIPSASLVPEGDASTLFTTAGMQPLVPYLLGETHPKGNRLVNTQKCLRTGDIDEVGDNTHLTFFEMLGNWSLGDYWKEEAIEWSYDFLINEEEGLGLDLERIYVTVFGGEGSIPKDDESKAIWIKNGVPEERIFYRGSKDNFWSPGDNGPCGPSTEIFYDLTGNLSINSPEEFEKADKDQKVVEIWNNVFMEYNKKDGEVIGELKQKNVDTGMGLERITAVKQKTTDPYKTDLFTSIFSVIDKYNDSIKESSKRIIADHMRAVCFAISDGVNPSNTDKGYVVRRLIRRLAFKLYQNKIKDIKWIKDIVFVVVKNYKGFFSELGDSEKIIKTIKEEVHSFYSTLENGLKVFNKLKASKVEPGKKINISKQIDVITAEDAFLLFSTHGFPVELTKEITKEKEMKLENDFDNKFNNLYEEHQERSKSATAGKFKGGLADHGEETVRLHTVHHLLLAALQEVLGPEVKQRGSNITPERLRIDFSFDRKLTDEEKSKVEELVNEWIKKDMKVIRKEMSKEEAEKIGAEMEFGAKYPDMVSVYFIEDEDGKVVSKEFCGGPHVKKTSEIGSFKLKKEQSSSKGIRRIKGVIK